MNTSIVIGAYWGDEGKGKIVDYLSEQSDLVVRFNGGDNAGHTIIVEGKKYVLHVLPSGALRGKDVAIGPDVFVNPESLLKDIAHLQQSGIQPGRILVDERAHVIMPYHVALDTAREQEGEGVGSTKKGIGPAAEDKANRKRNIRIVDLYSEQLGRKLQMALESRKDELRHREVCENIKDYASTLEKDYRAYAEKLRPYVTNLLYELEQYKSVLFEGAQGALLDVVHGTRPYVTSSNTTAGAAAANVRPLQAKSIGVVKAYPTRVGEGPFPTEIAGEEGERLREKGGEYGATTGRPRRVGHPDFVALKYSALLNNFDFWVMTKIDVLNGMHIKACTSYEKEGRRTDRFPAELEGWKPVYGKTYIWDVNWENVTKDTIPEGLQNYIRDLKDFTGVPVTMISYGPERSQTLWL